MSKPARQSRQIRFDHSFERQMSIKALEPEARSRPHLAGWPTCGGFRVATETLPSRARATERCCVPW
ncbi:hypothetical protein, partial [Rhodopseudomonas palustris]|uniref:hypothetical protein n=1 Tax=Rhodopseudomonas palustris TaxID=1076 RepID=UPI001AEBE084